MLCFCYFSLTAYGGRSTCIGFAIMCGVACSGLCIVIMCSKHALTLGADVTFIDCTSFCETNTSNVKCAPTMNTVDKF